MEALGVVGATEGAKNGRKALPGAEKGRAGGKLGKPGVALSSILTRD